MTRVPSITSRALAARRARADAPAGGGAPWPTPARRAFKAARPDRLSGGFHPFGLGVSQRGEVRQDLRGLVAHSREAARNLDYIRGFERMVARNVIGPKGIRLRAQGRDARGELAREANARIESAWAEWGRRGSATVCGLLSWWHVERIAAVALAREGNLLLRAHTGPSRGPFGFQVEVLPLDVLDLDLVQTLGGGRYIDGGLEFDSQGRPVAAHLWSVPPGETHTAKNRRRVRVPARELIHLYDPTEPAQALGVPAAHTALRRLRMVGRYEEAALTAAHFGAAAMAWIKRPEDDGPGGGADAADLLPEEVEAGMVAELPPGADLASWTPNYPDGELPAFTKHMLRGGAAGLGVAYSSLASDLEGANFSSLRAGLGEEREEWRMWQRVIAEGLHQEVFRRWLPVAALSGRLQLPASALPRHLEAVEWQGRGWASVNPKDDATAAEADLRNRLRAPSDILRDRGQDFEETAARIAADLETLAAAGVPLPEALTKRPAPADPAAPEPEPEAPAAPADDSES